MQAGIRSAPATGTDSVHGGDDDDIIREDGTDIEDFSTGGNIIQRIGGDTLHGDSGNDNIQGGTGHDLIYGDRGDDTLDGGEHDDFLDGGAGIDTLRGGTATTGCKSTMREIRSSKRLVAVQTRC